MRRYEQLTFVSIIMFLIIILSVIICTAEYIDLRNDIKYLTAVSGENAKAISDVTKKHLTDMYEQNERMNEIDAHVQYFISGGWK